ncbi:DsrE family protein [Bacteroidota bacterium]
MRIKKVFVLTFIFTLLLSSANLFAQEETAEKKELKPEEKLVVLWTSGDKDVAMKMVYMYTYNAKKYGWWEDITFIVWGASAKLLSEDKDLQEYIAKMKDEGIDLKACKACADMYGVSEKLEELGVIVKYMGVDLTNYIKEGRHVLTF